MKLHLLVPEISKINFQECSIVKEEKFFNSNWTENRLENTSLTEENRCSRHLPTLLQIMRMKTSHFAFSSTRTLSAGSFSFLNDNNSLKFAALPLKIRRPFLPLTMRIVIDPRAILTHLVH